MRYSPESRRKMIGILTLVMPIGIDVGCCPSICWRRRVVHVRCMSIIVIWRCSSRRIIRRLVIIRYWRLLWIVRLGREWKGNFWGWRVGRWGQNWVWRIYHFWRRRISCRKLSAKSSKSKIYKTLCFVSREWTLTSTGPPSWSTLRR